MAEVKMELSEFKRLEKTEEDLREALKISRTKELLKTTSILKLKGTLKQLREIWNIS